MLTAELIVLQNRNAIIAVLSNAMIAHLSTIQVCHVMITLSYSMQNLRKLTCLAKYRNLHSVRSAVGFYQSMKFTTRANLATKRSVHFAESLTQTRISIHFQMNAAPT